jgi:formylglycine-generating enzyme required for sulfatase activity
MTDGHTGHLAAVPGRFAVGARTPSSARWLAVMPLTLPGTAGVLAGWGGRRHLHRVRMPQPGHAKLPLLMLAGLFACVVTGQEADESANAPDGPEVITTKTGFEMVLIPAGEFRMGSDGDKADEAPAHTVRVDAFYMDRYEVTQEQYGQLVLGNPSHFKGAKNPMEQVSWAAATLYCNERSRAEGLEPCYDEDTVECNFEAAGYRLPTEAEWEYACRAGGSETDYYYGDEQEKLGEYGWFADNSLDTTHPVGEKKPNPWGLYDMHGNVAEWCNDLYGPRYYHDSPQANPRGPEDGEEYVLRGGAWNSPADECRSAYRLGDDPGFQDPCFRGDHIGFRCVRRAP